MKKLKLICLAIVTSAVLASCVYPPAPGPVGPASWRCTTANGRWFWSAPDRAVAINQARNSCLAHGDVGCGVPVGNCTPY